MRLKQKHNGKQRTIQSFLLYAISLLQHYIRSATVYACTPCVLGQHMYRIWTNATDNVPCGKFTISYVKLKKKKGNATATTAAAAAAVCYSERCCGILCTHIEQQNFCENKPAQNDIMFSSNHHFSHFSKFR